MATSTIHRITLNLSGYVKLMHNKVLQVWLCWLNAFRRRWRYKTAYILQFQIWYNGSDGFEIHLAHSLVKYWDRDQSRPCQVTEHPPPSPQEWPVGYINRCGRSVGTTDSVRAQQSTWTPWLWVETLTTRSSVTCRFYFMRNRHSSLTLITNQICWLPNDSHSCGWTVPCYIFLICCKWLHFFFWRKEIKCYQD